jgi:digeranylgeranylglycerophospholipid reductase
LKVAIIGAGIAGLACAHEFERLGVTPIIFEKDNTIGEQISHVGAIMEIISRPIKNPLKYVKNEFGIIINPINPLNTVIQKSPNKTTTIKGNLGYLLNRSKEPDDIKVQIYSQLKNTKIIFSTYADIDSLTKEFDYIIVANGLNDFTSELGCWNNWIYATIKGAVILGDFDPNTFIVWINKNYCKNGYAYLAPFSNKRASLNLFINDTNFEEIDYYWELFLNTENLKPVIVEEFKINHHSGYLYPYKVGNVLFAGNSGGALEPFLGFGVYNSIYMGVMAAQAIVQNKDYETLITPIINKNKQLYALRKKFNKLSNTDYDLLIASAGLPIVKQVMYYTPLNVIKLASFFLRHKS